MKATRIIVYTCGGLMITATVVGAIDYNKADKKGIFNQLYKEPEKEKVVQSGKDIDVDDYSRKAIAYEENDSVPPPPPPPPPRPSKKPKQPKKPTIEVVEQKETALLDVPKPPVVTQSKKKITLKKFGRGPLREVEEEEPTAAVDSVWNYR